MTGKHGSGCQVWQREAGVAMGGKRGRGREVWQRVVGVAEGGGHGSGRQAWQPEQEAERSPSLTTNIKQRDRSERVARL